MKSIVWSDHQFLIGNWVLDEQHKSIVTKVNEIVTLWKRGASKRDALQDLEKLRELFSRHFTVEEMMLSDAGSALLDEQREAHGSYCDMANEVILDDNISLEMILIDITEWWTNHILIEDMKFKGIL
ncbi:MAG: hemerythrin family protein [Gammaproteobacteria bacterium]|jgi:hemerythrin-like metal-binding protein|nr:hemerythrin family protein [Gammaproteobacteria bacterium]MBT3489222.1 hemerythrin family protein [Gammaproteobacteria bacterium]MBT3717778.1 hemerythrin family protein [Gammaproteobacteria bacterium]MBT3845159.1 hemerythrin family protein [Gammaproteobacteria bacterium]MBT3894221.1 hemerythrin family protein [Gammaproteobacteria bacterium]